jgi:hypothetical protein
MALMSRNLICKLWKNKLRAGDIVLVNKSNVRPGIVTETEKANSKHIFQKLNDVHT